VLVTSDGRELSKDKLMELVWHDQVVEENNLAVNIYNLRKILGERKDEHRYIITIPGVGYRFVADVNETTNEPERVFIESHTVSRIVVDEEKEDGNPTVREGVITSVPFNKGEIEAAKSIAIAPFVKSPNRKPLLIAFALVGFLLTAVFGGYWFYRNRPQASVIPAPEPRRQMTITRLTDSRQFACATISPDGKFVAYTENTADRAGSLFVHQIETNAVLQLLEPAERVLSCVNFSPDGSLIYYVVFDKRDPNAALYSVPVLGGTPKRILGNLGTCFTISPDGRQIAFYRNNREKKQGSLMIAAPGGGERLILNYNYGEVSFGFGLAWSPDGNIIAVSADKEPNDFTASVSIFGVDAASGAMKPLTTEIFYSIGKIAWTGDGRNLVFVGKRPHGRQQLFLMDYPSGAARQITNDLATYYNYGMGVTADSETPFRCRYFEILPTAVGRFFNSSLQNAD
jgi:DNA-binding winged helix-turn-helix (wHTH) protein/roadblock/LC7 domain-containing protein